MGARWPVVVGSKGMAWLLLSCATQQREPAIEQSSGSQARASGQAHPGDAMQPAVAEPARAATVRIVNVAPGRFVLGADAPAEVATAATLERRSAEGQWTPVPYELRESCTPPAEVPRCRALSPGVPFSPLSWNGTPCGPCCADQAPTPIESGTYRLTLTACSGSGGSAGPWSGPSFEMPGATDVVDRWRASSDVKKISMFRLNNDLAAASADDERRILGYSIMPGTEVVLSESVVLALRDWLRDPGGFSNAIMPRCFPRKKLGFRVERDVPEIGGERSEIAIEMGCSSIEVENREGGLRTQSFTYFGASVKRLRAILEEATPKTTAKKQNVERSPAPNAR